MHDGVGDVGGWGGWVMVVMLGIIFDCVCNCRSHVACVAYFCHTTLLASLASVAHPHHLVGFLGNLYTPRQLGWLPWHLHIPFFSISRTQLSWLPYHLEMRAHNVLRSHNVVRAHNVIWRCWRLHDGVGDGGGSWLSCLASYLIVFAIVGPT